MGEGQWLSAYGASVLGLPVPTTLPAIGIATAPTSGIQWDADYYKIDVRSGFRDVTIDCRFIHALGDINIQLLDRNGLFVALSDSTSDNEIIIDFTVPAPGAYYIYVYSAGNLGNTYDLMWSLSTTTPPPPPPTPTTPDDGGCSAPQAGMPTLETVFGTILSWFPLMLLLLLRNRQREGMRKKTAQCVK